MGRSIHVDRLDVAVSRPDKPLFPDGIAKFDLAGYYRTTADRMLPHMAGRPVAMERNTFVKTTGGKGLHVHVPLDPWQRMPRTRTRLAGRLTGR